MIIRRAAPSDVPLLCTIHNASIRSLCSADYTPEQIRDWTRALKPEGYIKAMEVNEFMMAVDRGIVGFCIFSMEKAEVTALYVAPGFIRQGTGRAFITEVESLAKETGLCELNLKSTLNAVGFYEKMGFIRQETLSFLLPGGTELPCVGMTKTPARG